MAECETQTVQQGDQPRADAMANLMHIIGFAISELEEIQATRERINGRHASLAITYLEEARYRVESLLVNFSATPSVNEEGVQE